MDDVPLDINECMVDNGGCHVPGATCENRFGRERICSCRTGYRGNGSVCLGELSVHALLQYITYNGMFLHAALHSRCVRNDNDAKHMCAAG